MTSELTDLEKNVPPEPMPLPVMAFTRVEQEKYAVEYGLDGEDIVFHFYPLAGYPTKNFWTETFPDALSEAAQGYFRATYPRLKAALTQELGINSWWFRANGFADSLDVEALVLGFFKKLSEGLSGQPTKG